VRAALAALDPTLPLYQAEPMPRVVGAAMATEAFAAVLLVGFSATAMTLAAVGIFGTVMAEVGLRHREIGIRLALGATSAHILTLFLSRGAWCAARGAVLGAVLSWLAARSMAALLFGVSPADLRALLVGVALVMLVATLAVLAPTWQALRRQPLASLREG
jgi:putative ABC transport system permease protein